jgi:hypothetical protein
LVLIFFVMIPKRRALLLKLCLLIQNSLSPSHILIHGNWFHPSLATILWIVNEYSKSSDMLMAPLSGIRPGSLLRGFIRGMAWIMTKHLA